MPMVSRIDVDPVGNNGSLSMARAGDLAARWGALEECRHYLQLVVGRNRFSKGSASQRLPDLVQDTILRDGAASVDSTDRLRDNFAPGFERSWCTV